MENDKQINGNEIGYSRDLERIKQAFLSDELLAKSQQAEVYSLADEYAKSKKNRNLLVYVLIFFYIAVIGTGVFLITRFEDSKSKRIEVNIAEFKQFNLMELLAEQKENQEKLVKLQQELDDLRINTKKELEKLSPREQQKALAAANEKMKKLEDAYNQEIKTREVSIATLEKTIAAEKQQMRLNNQIIATSVQKSDTVSQIQEVTTEKVTAEYEAKIDKLKTDDQDEINKLKTNYQDEIDKLKKNYQTTIDTLILRYNPIYSQGEIAAIINSKLSNTGNEVLNKYSKILADENLFDEQDFNLLHNQIHNQRVIIDNLLNIPYSNSMPPVLNRLDRLSRSIASDYETLWGNLAQRIKEKNDYLSSYEYALNYLSTIHRENGYVIDARDPNRLLIFIDHIYTVKKGDTAYIFNNDEAVIAKIELNPEHDRLTAKIIATLKSDKIEPFDRILLKLEVNQ